MIRRAFAQAIAVHYKRPNLTKLLLSIPKCVRGHLPQPAIAARGAAERLAVKHAEHHLDELVGQRLEEIAISTYHAERAAREITHESDDETASGGGDG
jgi:diacylglycerol kinase family enzyme